MLYWWHQGEEQRGALGLPRCVFALFAAFVMTLLAVPFGQARAQGFTPDAGSLLNQIERSLPPPKLPSVGPPPAPPKIELLKGQGETLLVKQFIFTGNTAIHSDVLANAVAQYLNRPLTFSDLQNAAAALAMIYREKGYIAAATIPKQVVKVGIVRFHIVESRFTGAVMDQATDSRMRLDLLLNRIEQALPPGRLVNVYDLDRGLLLIEDLPGVSVSGGLREGRTDGESEFVLLARDKPIFKGNASVDNGGSRSTGAQRINGDLSAESPTGNGELLTANTIHTGGSDYGRFSLTIPLSPSGTKFTASTSLMAYELVTPEFKSALIEGTSSSVGLELNHPLLRTRSLNVYATLGYDGRSFDNLANHITTSQYRTDAVSAGLAANQFDQLGGGGVNTASISYHLGRVNLDGSPNKTSDAAAAHTQGTFSKFKFNLSRSQTIKEDLTFFASVSGQYAFNNLDSSEKLFLGGSSGVRAYPSSEGGGSSGVTATFEARQQLPYGFEGVAFIDTGVVQQNTDNHYSGAPFKNILYYKGVGLSLVWRGDYNSTIKLTWSHRIGSNPLSKPDGHDQDGTKQLDRFWLSAGVGF